MTGTTSNRRHTKSGSTADPAAIVDARKLLKAPAAKRSFNPATGYLELIDDGRQPVTASTIAMQLPLVSSIYEHWWRPALTRVAKGMSGPTMSDEYASAQQLMHLTRGSVVLDLACGPGNFSRRFARTVGDDGLVVGYDGSRPMLDQAVRQHNGGVPDRLAYVLGEATGLPFKAGSFDAVCCFAALNMFPEPMTTLTEIARVLKRGGRVALLTSNISGGGATALIARGFGLVAGMTMFSERQLSEALEQRGFSIELHEASGATQMIGAVLN
jgi:ubiquinone/menaquinone biosynthesis C-methylase UbiE